MITLSDVIKPAPVKPRSTKSILTSFADKLRDLFTPEEVEVTFTRVGNATKYSYRKVNHKQIA